MPAVKHPSLEHLRQAMLLDTPFKQIIIAMGSGAASLGAFDLLIRHSDEETAKAA